LSRKKVNKRSKQPTGRVLKRRFKQRPQVRTTVSVYKLFAFFFNVRIGWFYLLLNICTYIFGIIIIWPYKIHKTYTTRQNEINIIYNFKIDSITSSHTGFFSEGLVLITIFLKLNMYYTLLIILEERGILLK